MNYIAGIYFLIEGVRDFRKKEIAPEVCLCFGLIGFICSRIQGRDWMSLLVAEVPGVICLFISFCTRQSVGYGDGVFLCGLGMLYELEDMVFICMIALVTAGIIGIVLLTVFRKKGNYEIPFVPFLFIGWSLLQVIK